MAFWVGSTSIPLVYAKPIIDIAILCGAKDLSVFESKLIDLGYDFRGQYGLQKQHYYAVFDKSGVRYFQIHLYTEATDDLQCKITFRDALNENPSLAQEYSTYKKWLVGQVNSKNKYAEVKSNWLDSFIKKMPNKPRQLTAEICHNFCSKNVASSGN